MSKKQSKTVTFDKVIPETASNEEVCDVLVNDNVIDQLINGISTCIIRIEGGEESEGNRAELFNSIIDRLPSGPQYSSTLLTVSDNNCVNMVSFAQIDPSEVLIDEAVESFEDIKATIEKGYSGSCVLMIKARHETGGTIYSSTLAVFDIVSGLDRSLTCLKNIALALEQPHACSDIPFGSSKLTKLLEPFIGGQSNTKVFFSLANHSVGVESKMLSGLLCLAEALRLVKNRPRPSIEPVEVGQLARLLDESAALEADHKATKAQIKTLKKHLATLTAEGQNLQDDLLLEKSEGNVSKWEREWMLSRLAVDNLNVQDQLRQCEIELLVMAHRKAILEAEIHETRFRCSQAQAALEESLSNQETMEQLYNEEIEELRNQLESSNKTHLSSLDRLEREAKDKVRSAELTITQLEERLNKTEKNRKGLETELEEMRMKWKADRQQLTLKEHTYSQEMATAIKKAHEEESALRAELSTLRRDHDSATSTIQNLQHELGTLKIENATLSAKLDVYAKFGVVRPDQTKPIVSRDSEIQTAISKIEQTIAKDRSDILSVIKNLSQANPVVESDPSPTKSVNEKLLNRVRKIPVKRKPVPSAVDDVEEHEPVKPAAVKLKPRKQVKEVVEEPPAKKEPAPQLFVKTRKPKKEEPQKKDEDLPPVEVEVENQPVVNEPEVDPSPVKPKAKASTFIPGVAASKPVSSLLKTKPNFLANLSFAAKDTASTSERKRIRLPERGTTATSANPDAQQPSRRGNVDPQVFQTIMAGFNIDKK